VPVTIVGSWLPRDALAQRIAARVVAMFDAGLIPEAEHLQRTGGLSATAAQAIGYQEALAHLEGALTLDDAIARTVSRTRAFARRQRVWFRRDPRVTWVATPDNPCRALPAVLALWGT
jgi:tRNA dimethylallyltransferase